MRSLLHQLRNAESGAETVELAIILPVVLLLALGTYPLLDYLALHRDIGRIADEAAVYAAKVDNNPTATADNASCGGLTRRRSYAEVRDFALAGHPSVTAVDVYAQPSGTAAPDTTAASSTDPCNAAAFSRIHVRLTAEYSTGPAAQTANAIARLVSGNDLFPSTAHVSAIAAAYLE